MCTAAAVVALSQIDMEVVLTLVKNRHTTLGLHTHHSFPCQSFQKLHLRGKVSDNFWMQLKLSMGPVTLEPYPHPDTPKSSPQKHSLVLAVTSYDAHAWPIVSTRSTASDAGA